MNFLSAGDGTFSIKRLYTIRQSPKPLWSFFLDGPIRKATLGNHGFELVQLLVDLAHLAFAVWCERRRETRGR